MFASSVKLGGPYAARRMPCGCSPVTVIVFGVLFCLANLVFVFGWRGAYPSGVSGLPSLVRRAPTAEERAQDAVLAAFVELLSTTVETEKADAAGCPPAGSEEDAARSSTRGAREATSSEDIPGSTSPTFGSSTASSGSSGSSAAAAAPQPPDLTTMYTQQTCYLSNDESELCVYENALCFDGEGPVVLVAQPIREPRRVLDYTHECVDGRYYEPSGLEWSNCHWAYATKRPYTGSSSTDDLGTEYSLPLDLRRWGPLNRNTGLIFKEVRPDEVLGNGEGKEVEAWQRVSRGDKGKKKEGHESSQQQGRGGGGGGGGGPGKRGGGGPTRRVNTETVKRLTPLEVLSAIDSIDPFDHPEIAGMKLRAHYKVPVAADAPPIPPPPPQEGGGGGGEGGQQSGDGMITIDWLDGALWLVGLELQWPENPFHFLAKASVLFDAQRNNATVVTGSKSGAGTFEGGGHPNDGFITWQSDSDVAVQRSIRKLDAPEGTSETRSKALWRQGGQWGPLPSLDTVLFVGEGATAVTDATQLPGWAAGVLDLVRQGEHTRTYFNDASRLYGPNRLLCARRGVVAGTKFRIFGGRSDAIAFRNRAYKRAGIEQTPLFRGGADDDKKSFSSTSSSSTYGSGGGGPAPASSLKTGSGHADGQELGSYPRFPPRKVTILNREDKAGRGIANVREVEQALRDLGIPFEVVPDMASLTFPEQVTRMAGTGILIAPHGAALTNLIFLPAHSAVIELFPFGMKKLTYANLAPTVGVHYFPVYSRKRLPSDSPHAAASILYSRYYYENCVATNVSSYDALVTHACHQASKLHPVHVPIEMFRETLWHAADTIGAFSLLNPEWQEEAEQSGLKSPTYEEWIEGRPAHMVGDNFYDQEAERARKLKAEEEAAAAAGKVVGA